MNEEHDSILGNYSAVHFEEHDSNSIYDTAEYLFVNFNASTEMKYTFRKIWRRLTPAQQNNIAANNDGDIPIAIPNLTPTEIFCSLAIEYLIARNFEVSFDSGATYQSTGSAWRNLVPLGCNLSLVEFHIKMEEHSFDVGCSLMQRNAIVTLTHSNTNRVYTAPVPINKIHEMRINFARNEYTLCCNQFILIAIENLDRKFRIVFSAVYENRDPPSVITSPVVVIPPPE